MARFSHAERLPICADNDGVEEKTVKWRDSRGLIGQEVAPLLEGPVAGQSQ
jgi:hypothetical protein